MNKITFKNKAVCDRVLNGMSLKDISSELGISVSAVRSHIKRTQEIVHLFGDLVEVRQKRQILTEQEKIIYEYRQKNL